MMVRVEDEFPREKFSIQIQKEGKAFIKFSDTSSSMTIKKCKEFPFAG